jgi:hypothetical protein
MMKEREAAQLARQEAAKKEKAERKPVDILRRTEALSVSDKDAAPASKAKEDANVEVKADAELAAIAKKDEASTAAAADEDGWTVNKKK